MLIAQRRKNKTPLFTLPMSAGVYVCIHTGPRLPGSVPRVSLWLWRSRSLTATRPPAKTLGGRDPSCCTRGFWYIHGFPGSRVASNLQTILPRTKPNHCYSRSGIAVTVSEEATMPQRWWSITQSAMVVVSRTKKPRPGLCTCLHFDARRKVVCTLQRQFLSATRVKRENTSPASTDNHVNTASH